MSGFASAKKTQARLRLALAGPPGAGKTYTSLLLATELADGGTVALIDTEHGSACKYGDRFTFDVLNLDSFSAKLYIDAIDQAVTGGYAVLIIDSLSHAWTGAGGVLEEKDRIAKTKYGGNSFNAWLDAGKLQNSLIDAILRAPLHVIVTMRSKTEYVIEQNERGRSAPRKVGLAPVQRDDVAYEFDVVIALDIENQGIVEKTRCPALAGQIIDRPGIPLAHTIRDWLSGETIPEPVDPPPTLKPAVRQELTPTEVAQESLRVASQPTLGDPPPVETKPKRSTAQSPGVADIISGMNALAQKRMAADHDVNTTLLIKQECLTDLGFEGPISDLPDTKLKKIAEWIEEQNDALLPFDAA